MRIVKRYSNRKLYDTISKSYITFENIEAMIKQGEEIQVLDNETGQDITAGTLSQIIAEKAKKTQMYSSSIFVDMIRKSGTVMFDYGRKVVKTLGDTVYSWEEEVEKKVKGLVKSGELTEEEGKEIAKQVEHQRNDYFAKLEKQISSLSHSVMRKLNIPDRKDLDKLTACIQNLEKTVADLEKKVGSLPQAGSPSENSSPAANVSSGENLQPPQS